MDEQQHNEAVDIPANVVVRCPLVDGKLRAVSKCAECPHCAGLNEALKVLSPQAPQKPFAARYFIRCKYPQDRQLLELEAGQAGVGQ